MFNLDVRNRIKLAGFFSYEVAAALGVAETSFSRSLSRAELSDDKKEHIFKTIEKMVERRAENGR